MASGGARPKQSGLPAGSGKVLTGRDEVSDRLLLRVSHCLDANRLEEFAVDELELPENDFKCIKIDLQQSVKERLHAALRLWYRINYKVNVAQFMEKLVAWIRDGYLSNDVWSRISDCVSPKVIPPRPQTQPSSRKTQVSNPSGGQTASQAAFQKLQRKVKQKLARTWKLSLSNDWLSLKDGAKAMKIQYYTDLRWKRKVPGGVIDSTESVSSIFDIIAVEDAGEKPMSILIEGAPGMGKTSTMAYLAMEWASKKSEDSRLKFELVFLTPLRNVDADTPLAEIIATIHGLKEDDVPLVQSILEGDTDHKVLLIFDGYDEYKKGTNHEIDTAIEDSVGNCFTVVTSRPGKDGNDETYVSKEVRSKMDGEVTIEGFSDESIEKCSELFLGSKEQSDAMLQQVKQKSTKKWWGLLEFLSSTLFARREQSNKYTGLWELLRTPITLLMICVLFNEKQLIQDTKTKIYEQIRTLSMNRTTKKKLKKETEEIDNLDKLLYWLGKFAWEALQNDHQQLLLNKNDIKKKHLDILKLGLLHEAGGTESATIGKKQIFVSFQHKTIQEFSAADFITKSVKKSPNPEETLKEFFPSIEVVRKQREVVQFCVGLMSNPTPLFNHLSSLYLDKMVKSGESPRVDQSQDLLNEMYRESQVELPTTEPHHPLYCYVMKRLLQQLSHCTELTELYLSGSTLSPNTLTGLLSEFTPDTPLHSLEKLELNETGLNRHDIRHLGTLTNRLPALRKLDLRYNTLTGLLPEFTPDTPLHSLEVFDLSYTTLSKQDVLHVAHLIRANKLPALRQLNLTWNSLCYMKDEVGKLIKAGVTHYQRKLDEDLMDDDDDEEKLELNLRWNKLSEESKEKWRRRCAGTNIILDI